MLRLSLALTLLLAAPSAAAAKPGDLDRTFAHGGRTALRVGAGYAEASGVTLDRSGRILVAGQGSGKRIDGAWTLGETLVRLTLAGTLDGGFGNAGQAFLSDPAQQDVYFRGGSARVAALPGGGALVGAELSGPGGGQSRVALFRVRADGSPDPAFGTGGAVVYARPGEFLDLAGMGVDASGRAVVAISQYSGATDTVVLRFLPTGALDPAYGVERPGEFAGALLVLADGEAYLGTTRNGTRGKAARALIRKLDAQGRVLRTTTLQLHAKGAYGASVAALTRGPRGSVIAAGADPGTRAHPSRAWIERIRSDGRPDRRFGRRGRTTTSALSLFAIARDHHGRIVLAGGVGQFRPRSVVARLTPGGRIDRRFGGGDGVVRKQIGVLPRTRLIASAVHAVAVDARDRIVLAGVTYDDQIENREDLGRSYFAVARLEG